MKRTRNILTRNWILISMGVVVLSLRGIVWAESFPHYTVDAMCDKADAIIEGTYLRKNEVQFDNIYKGSPLLDKNSKTVEVAQLQKHDRDLWGGFRDKGKALETTRLVLFLVKGSKTNSWESIATIDDDGKCGSCGLFWFDGSTCYGYAQVMNPGPFALLPAKDSERRRIPKTIADLRADIEIGISNSREWRRSLAIGDPSKKAEALARYLLKSTSPKGDKGSYLYAVREPMAVLGKHAVPALIQVLRNAPANEKLDTTVLILYDIGPPAALAVPDLHALLAQPERAFTGYILSALGSTGDSRAIPDLGKYTESDNERLAKDAREALAMLRKRQSRMSKETESRNGEQENAPDIK